MKEFFKSGKNIAILVLAIVLAGSVACNICLATRRCAPRGPRGNDKQFEQQHNREQAQIPQGNEQGQPSQGQAPQGQPPQGQPPQGQEPNAQAPQDGQNSQKKDSDKKGNNDDKKDSEDDDDKEDKNQ